jgi:hypothetical protein
MFMNKPIIKYLPLDTGDPQIGRGIRCRACLCYSILAFCEHPRELGSFGRLGWHFESPLELPVFRFAD